MKNSLSRALASSFAAAVATWAFLPAASAAPGARSSVAHISASAFSSAQLIGIYHDKTPTGYVWRPDRDSDVDGGWEAVALRDVVRAEIAYTDPTARFDDDGGPQYVSVLIEPDSLTQEQIAALMEHRMSRRIAAFHLKTIRVTQNLRTIDYKRRASAKAKT